MPSLTLPGQLLAPFGGAKHLDQAVAAVGDVDVPAGHWEFLEQCVLFYETDNHFFVHAQYEPRLALQRQGRQYLLWLSLRDCIPQPHISGKTAIVGHTPQADGRILDLLHLKCIDTGCVYGGTLTAMEVVTHQVWQVSAEVSVP